MTKYDNLEPVCGAVPGGRSRLNALPLWTRVVFFGLAYFTGAWAGDALTFQPSYFNTFWPNSGVFVAVLLLHPKRQWPLFLLAAIPANIAFDLMHHRPLWVSAFFTAGNCGEALVGAAILRYVTPSFALRSVRELLLFVFVSAVCATTVSATVGAFTVAHITNTAVGPQFLKWWTGDALGVLLFAPLLFGWLSPAHSRQACRTRLPELLALLAIALLMGYYGLWDHCSSPGKKFLLLPVILWSALRFGVPGVSLTSVLAAGIGVASAVRYHSEFPNVVHDDLLQTVLLQSFLAISIGSGLLLALIYRELQDSKAVYQDLVETAQDLIWKCDAEGRYTYLNPAWETVMGYRVSEMLGRRFSAFQRPEQAETDLREFQRLMQGHSLSGYETTHLAKDGHEVHLVFNAKFLRDGNGAIAGTQGTAYDITRRKQAETAARDAHLKREALFQGAHDTILVLDPETGRIVEANHKAEDLLGRPLAEIIGMHFEALHPEDLREQLKPVFKRHAEGLEKTLETEFMHGNGERLPVEISSSLVRTPDGRTLLQGIVRDTRERLRLEERLRQTEKMMAIGQLAAGVAHDFNNQLSGIMGYADLVEEKATTPQLKRYAQSILQSAQHAADLTQKLLAFGRKGKYRLLPVDLHRLIDEVLCLLERSIDKRIVIRFVRSATHPTVLGEPTQLQSALLNVALNARDAMLDGGILTFETKNMDLNEDDCRNHPDGIEPGRYVQVTIRDTGLGMDDNVKKHLFEPFFTTKERGSGMGMGLASVYGSVRNHHGTITIDSQLNQGTIVRICLPVAPPEEVPSEAPSTGAPIRGTARVLVVDDEPNVREMAVATLQNLGYTVSACSNGREALAFFRQKWMEVDLVVLDMVMPELSGREAYHTMRQINPRVRVLLFSGYSLDAEAQQLLQEGVIDFIGKPFRQTELARKVANVLAKTIT